MPQPYTDTLATVAAGRTAFVARLRALATRVEELPLDAAAAFDAPQRMAVGCDFCHVV
jgi:hypothetical protein